MEAGRTADGDGSGKYHPAQSDPDSPAGTVTIVIVMVMIRSKPPYGRVAFALARMQFLHAAHGVRPGTQSRTWEAFAVAALSHCVQSEKG